MRKLLCAIVPLLLCLTARAQVEVEAEFFSLPEEITPEYIDSVKIETVAPNDYWSIGVYGGASAQVGYFNPPRLVKAHYQLPVYGFSVIRHFTMFGIFPNMGLEFGAQQNYEGYEFKTNKESGYRATESGAYAVEINVPEAFFLTHFHIDMADRTKLTARLGVYGGYRTSIRRILEEGYENTAYVNYVEQFRDYDRRWTYGVQGGLGGGIMIDPFEFQLNIQVKWGWESFWEPDYASKYYYRFAYPLDVALTFGLYYQLTPRHGYSRAKLRKMAKDIVNMSWKQEQ